MIFSLIPCLFLGSFIAISKVKQEHSDEISYIGRFSLSSKMQITINFLISFYYIYRQKCSLARDREYER